MFKYEYADFCNVSVIVNFGMGSKVLKLAKENGINGGTIILGRGTYFNKVLDLFGLNDTRKEIIIMVVKKHLTEVFLDDLEKRLSLNKKNTGIVFCTDVSRVVGIKNTCFKSNEGVENKMYQAIYTIVEKGNGNDVVEAASNAGAKGGTIIDGRGAGAHETLKVFGIEIEPEKDIVLTLVPTENMEVIVEAIRNKLNIDDVGKGIIFVQPVTKVIGLNS